MAAFMPCGEELFVYKDLDINTGDISADEKDRIQTELENDKEKASRTESLFQQILVDLFETETFSLLKLLDPYSINIKKLQPIMVGSISEGFGLVEYIQFGEDDNESVARDEVDFNLVWNMLKIDDPGYSKSTEADEDKETHFDAQVDFSSEFPGYATIRLINNEAITRWIALSNVFINGDGSKVEVYLHPLAVSDEFFMQLRLQSILCTLLANLELFISDEFDDGQQAILTKLKDHKVAESRIKENPKPSEASDSQAEEKYDMNENLENYKDTSLFPRILFILDQAGPAVSINMFHDNLKGGSLTFDMAPSLPLFNWPTAAKQWIARHRPSGWPSQEQISSIVQEGCTMVPVCPTRSQTGLEWRVSFSSSERILAQSLTEAQKVCYLIVKAIWKHFLKHPTKKGLQSYHLKTTMFWVCEEVPTCEWTSDNTPCGVLKILQKLYLFLLNMYCPHYFIPENNLFRDIEGGVLLDTLQRVTIAIVSRRQIWYDNPGLFTMLSPENSRLHFDDLEDKAFREGIQNIFRFCLDLIVETNDSTEDLMPRMIYNIKEALGKCCRSQDTAIYFLAGFFLMFNETLVKQYQISAYDMRRFLGSRMSPRMLALKEPIPLDIFIELSAGLEMFKLAFKLFSLHVIHNDGIDENLAKDSEMTHEQESGSQSVDEEDSDSFSDEMMLDLMQALARDSDSDKDEDVPIER